MTAAGTALWRRSSRAMVGFGAFRAQHVSRRYNNPHTPLPIHSQCMLVSRNAARFYFLSPPYELSRRLSVCNIPPLFPSAHEPPVGDNACLDLQQVCLHHHALLD